MSKLRYFGRKLAALGATAATFGSNTVASLFPQSSNTVATLIVRCFKSFLPSKTPINGSSSSSSSNTFPNLSESNDIRSSWELGDEFDHEDFDEWWDTVEDEWNPEGHREWRESWHKRAVDEAIEEEQDGDSLGDIPF